ncbi:YadA-like family protein [Megasphaera sp. UPII 135-E]|uniref:YadA-like family protein n=1 Tax=Megasphaera sp. UPII 135-E TaxID=1000569 RepID=UPI00021A291D|nr:YadA-like family protein [Megasphaera sp. UPII 135-E]EGS31798.1 Hep/Hag repeat protein [Megasphaera sp. UPII 135-E]
MKHDVTNRTNTLTYKAERRLNNTKVRLVAALVMALPLMVSSTVYAAEPPAATTLTPDQQVVYNAVLQELAKNGVHYVSVKGTSQDNDSNYKNDGAKQNGGIAIGEKAKSTDSSDIAIGSGANSAGGWGMAIGVDAKNTAQLGMAIGYATKVEAAQGLALGVQAKVTNTRGIGIGTNANVSGEDGISFGSQASASGQYALSIGTNAGSSAKRGIAVGTNSSVVDTAARGIAIGDGAYVGPVTEEHKGTAMPKPGDEWKPVMPFQPTDDDTNPAVHNKTAQENSLAIGMRAGAFGYQNVAIGAAAEAHDTNSTAVGVAAVARGHHSTALGKQARTYGQETTSVGHWADTRDEFATALGAKSIAFKKGSTALGSNALAYDENSVAIGANSIAKEAMDGKALYTNEEVKAAAGIVSVGNPAYKVGDTTEVKANYRRIVNVAGGIMDHDAVNVAQLKAVANMVTKGAVHYISVKGESQDNDSNYKNDGAKGKGAVAIGEKALAAKGGTVSIGRNAQILGSGGNTDGEGSVAIGDNTLITTNGLDLASIAIGKNAKVLNGSGKQERGLSFTPDNFDKPGFLGSGNTLPKNADKVPGGIAIGTNTYARTGSIQIGAHTFVGYKMGGIDITDKTNDSESNIVGMTTIGTNTYNKGAFANMYGAYSVITGGFTGEGRFNSVTYGPQNFGANVVGSLNSIRSKGHSGSSGIANSIVGVANTVENANGTLVYGAGNKITNSVTTISAPSGLTTLNTWEDTVTTLQKSIKDSNSGGAVLAIGGGNVADYVRHSQLVGVNNTVTGTENKVSEFNMIDGYKNTVTNGTHVTMIGSENTATDSESTVVMGDKQKVTKVKHGVLLGSQDAEKETTVADVVAIGHNAHVQKEGGVALGSGAIAKRDKGAFGYDVATGKVLDEAGAAAALGNSAALKPLAEKYTAAKAAYEQAKQAVDAKQQEVEAIEKVCGKMCIAGENADKKTQLKHELNKLKTTLTEKQKAYEESQTAINNSLYTWKSTAAAVSVGDVEKGITRQITGVAAGTEDTDAVNVAQLKRVAAKIKDVADNAGSKVDIKGGDTGITVKSEKDNKTGVTTYTVGLGNTIKAGNVTINGEASADNGKDGKSTITGLSNTTWDGANIVSGRAATEDQLKAAVEKVVSGSAKQTTVTKGTNIVVTEGSNTAGGKDYTVALDKNLTGLESATFTKTVQNGDKEETTSTVINDLGTTVTDKDGNKTETTAAGITITTKKDGKENTVSLKNDGLHNGDHKILGVADGRIAAQSRDAVNGGQVYRMMREAAAATDGKVGAAAAGSAALAALHPLDFDPDAKWNVAASYGTYGHYQAYALGAYYRPSESSMVSVGGTIGSGADAMNVGLSFKVGKGNLNHISTLRMAMAKEIQELQRKNEVMRKQNEAANDRIAQLEQRLAALEARLK